MSNDVDLHPAGSPADMPEGAAVSLKVGTSMSLDARVSSSALLICSMQLLRRDERNAADDV